MQQNQGVSVARNTGIANASHDYIAFLDADDSWSPHYLQKISEIIRINDGVKIIGSKYCRVISDLEYDNTDLSFYCFKNYFKSALKNTYFTSSSSVIVTSFFKENEGFNPNLMRGEDLDVWFRAVASGGKAFYIENILVYYSAEDNNQTTKNKVLIKLSLVGNINSIYSPLFEKFKDQNFEKFVSKFVYFNLYNYYFDMNSFQESKIVLKENKYFNPFLHWIYWIPFNAGAKVISSSLGNRLVRKYYKIMQKCF